MTIPLVGAPSSSFSTRPVEPKNHFIKRVWQAVVDFFTSIASKIQAGIRRASDKIKHCFNRHPAANSVMQPVVRPPVAVPVQPNFLHQIISAQLNLYRSMPVELATKILQNELAYYGKISAYSLDFFKSAIQIAKVTMRDENPQHLEAFEQKLRDQDESALIKINLALARVNLFRAENIKAYLHSDTAQKLNSIRQDFTAMPVAEKLIVLKYFDLTETFSGDTINQLSLSLSSKKVLKELREMANSMRQNHPELTRTIAEMYELNHFSL